MRVDVSPLTARDAEAVREIAKECGLEIDVEAELARSWALSLVARVAVAAEPEQVVGVALAWRAADELHLTDLGTLPAFRRRGVARALVSALITEGRSRAARLVLLEVRRSNLGARRLYESLGFYVVGERKNYYSDDGEDAVEMRIDLR